MSTPIETDTINENDITNICRIAQGLLASGHYTHNHGDISPAVIREDYGNHVECVVTDALDVYDQIRDQWTWLCEEKLKG